MTSRYSGRPFLKLVDCYVLNALGALPSIERDRLESFAPRLRTALGCDAQTWQGIVEEALELESDFPDLLRKDYRAKLAIAASAGGELTPGMYATTIGDSLGLEPRGDEASV